MRHRLRYLNVDELLVHDIPQKLSRKFIGDTDESQQEEPMYSQAPSLLSPQIGGFFRGKIISTISSYNAFDVVVDPSSASPVPELIQRYLCVSGLERIPLTQQMTTWLYDKQTARNSAGLLLFIRCLIDDQIALAILKVEREEGVRVQRQTVESGLFTFDLEHVRDLMLTEKTKLFKIALFWEENNALKGFVCDQQKGSSAREVAEFFVSDFLGCMLTEEPEILTKKFFEVTEKYLNECIESAEEKAAFLNHLTSELTSQRQEVSPMEFARRVLPENRRDSYVRFVAEHSAITSRFPKDLSLIEKRLKNTQIGFASGIVVTGAKDALEQKSVLMDTPDGLTKFEIVDELKKVVSK